MAPFNGNPQSYASPVTALKPNCLMCPAASACLTRGISQDLISQWNGAVQNHLSLGRPGKALFETGDAANAIYVVRAGCIKSLTVDGDGNERVRAFHLPGEIVGLDAWGAEHHPSTAVAVVPSQVCRIPKLAALQKLAESPLLAQRLLERFSHDLAQAQALAGDFTADQRVAGFLLAMRARLARSTALKLPMTRRDIANFLRLATETVCRVLTRFESRGWIRSDEKNLQLANESALLRLAEPIGIVAPLARAA